MERNKLRQQQTRINSVLYYIHGHLNEALVAQELAERAAYSPHHFHRVFKQVCGTSVNHYIRSARLELAANRLMFEPDTSVIDIAQGCGFQSPASFSQVFKKHFTVSPSNWRAFGYNAYFTQLQEQQKSTLLGAAKKSCLPNVTIKPLPARDIAYVRHLGYDRSITHAWQYLRAWAFSAELDWDKQEMIGLHHSNPDIVALDQCRYVAAITLPTSFCHSSIKNNNSVGVLTIPSGSYASMKVTGTYGDLLPVMHNFYHQWLPTSGYELGTTPGYAIYRDNHFLNSSGQFDLDFCIPVWV